MPCCASFGRGTYHPRDEEEADDADDADNADNTDEVSVCEEELSVVDDMIEDYDLQREVIFAWLYMASTIRREPLSVNP